MIANMTHQKYIVVIASAYICELVHLHWCEDSQNHCQVLLSCEKFFFCLLIHFFVYIANNMYYWKGCLKSLTNFCPKWVLLQLTLHVKSHKQEELIQGHCTSHQLIGIEYGSTLTYLTAFSKGWFCQSS